MKFLLIVFVYGLTFVVNATKEISAQTIELSPDDNIRSEIYNAPAGAEILLGDGIYKTEGIIQVHRKGITVRSKSGNRNAVILDGNERGTPLSRSNFISEIFQISASDITIADMTIRYASCHSIHAMGASDHTIKNLTLKNLHIYDCGEQLIKINSNGNQSNTFWVDSGLVENCLIEFIDNSVMSDMGTYFYTGGIDVHGGKDWVIRNNTFKNIWREDKSMEHAIHFWSRSRNNLIENNTFVNCWRAVGLGMKTSQDGLVRSYGDNAGESPYFDHIDGMVRNNVIYNDESHRLETGVELMNVSNIEVYHNTIVSIAEPFNCMEYRWPNTTAILKNNLCTHRIMERDGARAQSAANITNASVSFFVNSAELDFHLKSSATTAIDQGVSLSGTKAGVDMDRQLRNGTPDIGADERDGLIVVPRLKKEKYMSYGMYSESPLYTTISGKKLFSKPTKDRTSLLNIKYYSGKRAVECTPVLR